MSINIEGKRLGESRSWTTAGRFVRAMRCQCRNLACSR